MCMVTPFECMSDRFVYDCPWAQYKANQLRQSLLFQPVLGFANGFYEGACVAGLFDKSFLTLPGSTLRKDF
jgi:hypothetical protein